MKVVQVEEKDLIREIIDSTQGEEFYYVKRLYKTKYSKKIQNLPKEDRGFDIHIRMKPCRSMNVQELKNLCKDKDSCVIRIFD